MTLGLLKKALTRFPPDADELEVVLKVLDKKEAKYFLLSGVGYFPDAAAIVLLDDGAAQAEVEKPNNK